MCWVSGLWPGEHRSVVRAWRLTESGGLRRWHRAEVPAIASEHVSAGKADMVTVGMTKSLCTLGHTKSLCTLGMTNMDGCADLVPLLGAMILHLYDVTNT